MIIFQFYTASRQKQAPETAQGTRVEEKQKEEGKEISTDTGMEQTLEQEKVLEGILAKRDTTREQEKSEKELVVIETNLLTAYLNSTGGVLDSLYLKDYGVNISPLNKTNTLLSTEMLKGNAKFSTDVIPFDAQIEDIGEEKIVTFSYLLDSLEVKKVYFFRDDSYLMEMQCLPQLEYLYKISSFDTGEEVPRGAQYSGLVYSVGKKVQNVKKGALFKGKDMEISGTIDWAGYKTKYFLIGLVPDDYIAEFTVNKSPDNPIISLRSDPSAKFYLGPLRYPLLASAKKGLEDAIYFGWGFIRPISKGLYYFMKFLHGVIHNYGVVIIVFAIAMILVLSPITMSSFRSMGKMQNLQPKMQEIREKYKSDPQRMNKEVMELYHEYGVNPLSSCLPLLLQFPIFFALYSVLNSSIELKGAPFILWIKDLSLKDPYYVLPILMGVSMFLQQRFVSPQQGSDQQKILSFLMPIIITFVFLSFPSGLVLYWLVYNILMIFVQGYIRKQV